MMTYSQWKGILNLKLTCVSFTNTKLSSTAPVQNKKCIQICVSESACEKFKLWEISIPQIYKNPNSYLAFTQLFYSSFIWSSSCICIKKFKVTAMVPSSIRDAENQTQLLQGLADQQERKIHNCSKPRRNEHHKEMMAEVWYCH